MKKLFLFVVLKLSFITFCYAYTYSQRDFMIEKSLIVNEMLARIETELGTEISYIKYKEPALMQGKRHTLWNSASLTTRKFGLLSTESANWMSRLELRSAWRVSSIIKVLTPEQ